MFVTAKRLWQDQQKKSKKEYPQELSDMEIHQNKQVDIYDIALFDELIKQEETKKEKLRYMRQITVFQQAFKQLGQVCQDLLRSRHIHKIPTKIMAEQFHFKNHRVVITKLSRCKEQVIKYYKKIS